MVAAGGDTIAWRNIKYVALRYFIPARTKHEFVQDWRYRIGAGDFTWKHSRPLAVPWCQNKNLSIFRKRPRFVALQKHRLRVTGGGQIRTGERGNGGDGGQAVGGGP